MPPAPEIGLLMAVEYETPALSKQAPVSVPLNRVYVPVTGALVGDAVTGALVGDAVTGAFVGDDVMIGAFVGVGARVVYSDHL